jgi:hypothetical protein
VKKDKLFNINITLPPSYSTLKDGEAPAVTVGVINTHQSAITFAGAPVLVTIIWKVVGSVFPAISANMIFPVVLSLIIGMLIYWRSAPTGATMKDKILGFIFALLNSFAIAASVLGINSTVTK